MDKSYWNKQSPWHVLEVNCQRCDLCIDYLTGKCIGSQRHKYALKISNQKTQVVGVICLPFKRDN